jgi:tetratricopeptide (TPR) repeat protein
MKQILLLIFLFLGLLLSAQTKDNQKLSFDEYFFESMNERLKENFKKSNDLLEQCLSIDNTNDVVFFKMAQNYFDLKDYSQSLIYLKKAQDINPDNKWYQKLFIEIKIKQHADKKEIFKLIKEFEPIAQNKYLIGDLYRQAFKEK